jgi:Ca2+-binding RTX toxin-like protein
MTFVSKTDTTNPFNGINGGYYSTPTFADIDGDSDLDLVVGASDGTLNYYKNTGSAIAPIYQEQTGDNPFNGIDVGSYSKPTLADIDGDGDFDLVVGERNGNLNYYKNTGSAIAPIYQEQTGDNPFNSIDVGSYSKPTFADIDGDGDFDLVVGEYDGNLNYYKNTGSAIAPIYQEQTGDNPFNGINVGYYSTPTFADIDGDGDLDLVVGEEDGTLNYYKNTGSAIAPIYEEQADSNNPFNGIDIEGDSAPTFADIDGDGDLDLVVGASDGSLKYYKNEIVNNQAATDITLTNSAIAENINTDKRVLIGTLSITDPDETGNNNVLTLGGDDADKFEIIEGQLYLKAGESVDFETKSSYDLTVTATDGDLTYTKALTVDVNDLNEAATNITLSASTIDENVSTIDRVLVGNLSIIDPDATDNNNVLSLGGNDAGKFEIIEGQLYLKAGESIDFDTKPNYDLKIFATDGDLSYEKQFTIAVNGTASVVFNGKTNVANNITGTDKKDKITGGNLNDFLNGGAGNDVINGGDGNDVLNGGTGNDTLNGENGNDVINGGEGNDIITGGKGKDNLNGGEGNDTISGGAGDDIISAGSGDDTILITNTDDGRDYINGENGNDTLDFTALTTGVNIDLSNNGSQTVIPTLVLSVVNLENIKGGSGDDKIAGNAQNNTLAGGAGRDTFVFGNNRTRLLSGLGVDTITDFTTADDKIQLSKSTFSILNTTTGLTADKFSTVTTDLAAENSSGSIIYNSSNGKLFYNANLGDVGFGTNGGQFAQLSSNLLLTNSSFAVVV